MGTILGISAYYHDSAAALVKDGEILSASQEERYSRIKHDPSFPKAAIQYCLDSNGISLDQVDQVVFYDKPLLKFERLLETYLSFAPHGFRSFIKSMPVWLKEKLFLKTLLRKELAALLPEGVSPPPLLFSEHHLSHAASCYFPSPFEDSAVLCLDGVGEWATSSAWHGKNNTLTPLWEIQFPHSLGLLYSAFTYFCGFKVNSGEYKLMGLAPYGEPRYVDKIKEHLIDIKSDGSFRLNMKYFDFATGLRMTNSKFARFFDLPARTTESELRNEDLDLAKSIQVITEEVVLKLAKTIQRETGSKNLCLAGGVALNCVANGKILKSGIFEKLWIQPASGDAGGALGAALIGSHCYLQEERTPAIPDGMKGSLLGDRFSNTQVKSYLESVNANFSYFENKSDLIDKTATLLTNENIVGWFNGSMEFGPRALGNRSILGDPRSPDMQTKMNLKIKFRESFRPFAPSVLSESYHRYFDLNQDSPYMLITAPVQNSIRHSCDDKTKGLDQLKQVRSSLPAITHVDFSARVQTVHKDMNPTYHQLIHRFEELTGCPVLINTSFNVRGEPPVRSPEDAFKCFMSTNMDILVLENFILHKDKQPEALKNRKWEIDYELD